jgi:hypothetical protein
MPLRREGFSQLRSFWYGQLSAVVEPLAGVIGAAAVLLARPLLPYALAFAAGAMIFVVVEELIPESQRAGNTDLATLSTISGFTVMMVLDVAAAATPRVTPRRASSPAPGLQKQPVRSEMPCSRPPALDPIGGRSPAIRGRRS